MHALVVVAHPDPASLTHAVAQKITEGIEARDAANSSEIADLTVEGFDPRFTKSDIASTLTQAAPSADVRREQSRIERADALVLVWPVYWWSMPGLLKGWIDRVFVNGWAYDDTTEDGRVRGLLAHLPVHLVGLGGAGRATWDRRGYTGAMKTQIDHGIFGYCGAPVITSEILLPSDPDFPRSALNRAQAIGYGLFT